MIVRPETVVGPLIQAYDAAGLTEAKATFVRTVARDFPKFSPTVRWLAQHLSRMADEPDLLPNGDFSDVVAQTRQAVGWHHADWGSARCSSNAFVVAQGTARSNCYYFVSIRNCESYLACPEVHTRLTLKGGKWFLLQSRMRSYRDDGVFPDIGFSLSYPGSKAGIYHRKCHLLPCREWFDVVWLFRSPDDAAQAVLYYLGSWGAGQSWLDYVSLKQIPDALTAGLSQQDVGPTYPALRKADAMPEPLVIDFARPLPAGVRVTGRIEKRDTDACLELRSPRDRVHVHYVFRSMYDLRLTVATERAAKARLVGVSLAYEHTGMHTWALVGKQPLSFQRQTTDAGTTLFTSRYRLRRPTHLKVLVLVWAQRPAPGADRVAVTKITITPERPSPKGAPDTRPGK